MTPLFYTQTIRKFFALAMLVVFAFSITPQRTIHDFVAKHLDPTNCAVHKNVPIEQVESTPVHCTFDFQVTTAPFVLYQFDVLLKPSVNPVVYNDHYRQGAISYLSIASESRGPPAL